MIKLAPILLLALAATARAGILIDFNNQSVTAEFTAPDLTQYLRNSFVWQATPDQIVFGGFFPDLYNHFDPGSHGLIIAPPSSLDTGIASPWSLQEWSANTAVARVNITGLADPFWQPPAVYGPGEWLTVGEVTFGFDALRTITTASTATVFDIRGVPVDSSGNPWLVSYVGLWETMTNEGPIPLPESTPILPSPEPATLAILLPAILIQRGK